uniref:uncharacterized protein LOC122609154 n=1 Tax=Erigeron canadensis TaxID=72917 RepID=UPI001CB9185B|nr:uncharacterized protein LOC122609154 [Erigeron canadensis]
MAVPTMNPQWALNEKDMLVQMEPGPFTQWIEEYPLPQGARLPKGAEMYDGKDDPDNHLKHFNAIIRMERWTVPVACHMFALTLKDTARAWLDGLPMGSIMNFEDLKTKFRSFFSQQRKYKKIHLEAHNIKRKDNESIRQFITRYTEETSLIKGLNEDQKISGFVHGLQYRPLVEFLSQDLPATYTSVMDKTYTFLTAKETAGEVHGAHAPDGRPPWGGGPGSGGKRGRVYRNERVERHKHSPYPSHPRGPPLNRGTLFTPPRPQRDVLATERLPPRDRSKERRRTSQNFVNSTTTMGTIQMIVAY